MATLADNSGTDVGESPDFLFLYGTVVGESPDHVCWDCSNVILGCPVQ